MSLCAYASDYTLNDPHYDKQTNLSQVYAQFAWERGVFGKGVKIAIIDSGLYNAASDFTFSNIIKVKDYVYTDGYEHPAFYDETGHGSASAGIIAAAHNNNLGIAGIAPQSQIYIFKCAYINSNGIETVNINNVIDAMQIAIDDYNCDIINLSLGLTTDYARLKKAVEYAEEKGVLVVAAAGNDGSMATNTYYPAAYDTVVAVGSVKSNGHVATHSQRCDYVNIVAPGENIYSVTKGGYSASTGTSLAAPHVAAAAALAKSLNPDLTAKELREALYSTATAMKDNYSGNGLLNIQALLTYVKSTMSKGRVIYSANSKATYSYFTAPDNYIVYSPVYEDDMLTTVESFLTLPYDESLPVYVWKKWTLEPYAGIITREEY